jgi:hypothetical protein
MEKYGQKEDIIGHKQEIRRDDHGNCGMKESCKSCLREDWKQNMYDGKKRCYGTT